jgi:murein DD-endopeptidase MepM/ murein hydrolase activator NlpD
MVDLTYPFQEEKRITSSFEDHKARTPPSTAPGTDFGARTGTAILAPIAGTVEGCQWREGGGRSLWIQGDGVRVYVAHMSQVSRLTHERVKAGQKVGEVGSTGHSTGPHLHLSLQVKNARGVYAWVDPMEYMQPPTPS